MAKQRKRKSPDQGTSKEHWPDPASGDEDSPDTNPITFNRVVKKDTEWVLQSLLPHGVATMLVGETGTGKSTFLAAVAAHVTGGTALDGKPTRKPGRVLLYTPEEDIGSMTKPRLTAAGAKLHLVHAAEVQKNGVPIPRIGLPNDLHKLENRIVELGISCVMFDPLPSYLASGVDVRDNQQIRCLLEGLGDICSRQDCFMIGVVHYRKSRDGTPLDWVGGCPAWTQVPPFVLALGKDPDNANNRVMACSKSRLGQELLSRRFSLEEDKAGARFVLGSPTTITAGDMGTAEDTPADRDAMGDAIAFLRDVLDCEEHPAKDLVRRATEQGISLGTLRRAKVKLGIKSHPVGPNGTRFQVWRKPASGWPQ
jgi:hypothetical protein